jgi:hypothetical protein
MRTILSVFLLMTLAATAACSGAGSDPKPEGREIQCGPSTGKDDAGKPTCEKGCYWDGNQCKPDRGIIVYEGQTGTPTGSTSAPPASQ